MNNTPFFLQSIDSVSSKLNSKLISLEEITWQFVDNLRCKTNVNAWVQDSDLLIHQITRYAEVAETSSTRMPLPLKGIIVGVKDNISTIDFPTLMGTEFWKGTPGSFDARVVSRMRNLGAIVGGKTRCSEFAVHQRTQTLNPRYLDSEPGTSSSGSAAAVANGEVSIALGTQTAGSIIKPASYCGVIGFKPSFGDIPRTGVLKTTELFDTVGFLGRRVSDIEYLYKQLRVTGRNYPIHMSKRREASEKQFDQIVLFSGSHVDDTSVFIKQQLVNLGRELSKRLQIPFLDNFDFDFEGLREHFYNVYYRDLAYFIRDHNVEKSISEELGHVLEFGLNLEAAAYTFSRQKIFEWQSFIAQLDTNPLILSLATSNSAPKVGKSDLIDANVFITSAGLPQICLPLLRSETGQLIGVSISSKRFYDEQVLRLATTLCPFDALTIPSFDFPVL